METRRTSERLRACPTAGQTPELVPEADPQSATRSDEAGRSKRLARGEGQKSAILAVRAFHSPVTKGSFKSKADAAAAYGISKQLYSTYESELANSGVLVEIQQGRLPAPELPPRSVNMLGVDGEALIEGGPLSSPNTLNMDIVKELIVSRCTRLGDDAQYGSHGTVGMYREGLKWAVGQMHDGSLPRDGRQASQLLSVIGVNVSHMTLHSKVKVVAQQDEVCIVTPQKAGIQSKIPYRFELELAKYVQMLRALKLKAGKSLMIGAANFLIRGTSYADSFQAAEVRYGWYYSFRKRWGIKVKNQTRLEMDRARWTTADHMKNWYQVVMEGMIASGIAVPNESFDPDLPYDTLFTITDPDMVYEWDQTGFSLDQTDDGKGTTEKTMTIDQDDVGECVANKSNVRWTLTGGSFLTGDSLPGCATPGAQGVKLSLLKDPPLSTIIDPATRKGRPCQFYPHQSGGFSYDLAPLWMTNVVGPCLPRKEGKRAYGLCDGYGAHTTLPMVLAAEKVQSDLQLRVPHTSHVSQVADVANFPLFKRKAKQAKSDLLVAKVMEGKAPRLTSDDMPVIIKKPWEEAFHPDVSRKGWREIGFDPATKSCNRKLYWDLKAKEDAVATKLANIGADDAVLDVRCQQFKQGHGGHASAAGDPKDVSDSSDSGDSDAPCNVDNMRLGAEDFMLGPLTYGAGRRKLEERFKRKQEQESLKEERAQKKAGRDKQQAEQRQLDAKAAAKVLWESRAAGVKPALQKLHKKHLASILVLTKTPNIKGNETNVILLEALEKKLAGGSPEESSRKFKELVQLFMDWPDESDTTSQSAVPLVLCANSSSTVNPPAVPTALPSTCIHSPVVTGVSSLVSTVPNIACRQLSATTSRGPFPPAVAVSRTSVPAHVSTVQAMLAVRPVTLSSGAARPAGLSSGRLPAIASTTVCREPRLSPAACLNPLPSAVAMSSTSLPARVSTPLTATAMQSVCSGVANPPAGVSTDGAAMSIPVLTSCVDAAPRGRSSLPSSGVRVSSAIAPLSGASSSGPAPNQ